MKKVQEFIVLTCKVVQNPTISFLSDTANLLTDFYSKKQNKMLVDEELIKRLRVQLSALKQYDEVNITLEYMERIF